MCLGNDSDACGRGKPCLLSSHGFERVLGHGLGLAFIQVLCMACAQGQGFGAGERADPASSRCMDVDQRRSEPLLSHALRDFEERRYGAGVSRLQRQFLCNEISSAGTAMPFRRCGKALLAQWQVPECPLRCILQKAMPPCLIMEQDRACLLVLSAEQVCCKAPCQ